MPGKVKEAAAVHSSVEHGCNVMDALDLKDEEVYVFVSDVESPSLEDLGCIVHCRRLHRLQKMNVTHDEQ